MLHGIDKIRKDIVSEFECMVR